MIIGLLLNVFSHGKQHISPFSQLVSLFLDADYITTPFIMDHSFVCSLLEDILASSVQNLNKNACMCSSFFFSMQMSSEQIVRKPTIPDARKDTGFQFILLMIMVLCYLDPSDSDNNIIIKW